MTVLPSLLVTLVVGVLGWSWPLGTPQEPPTVLARFDPPAVDWLPGHRGVDLAGSPGRAVRAAGEGVVVHAGPVAQREVVSIAHPSGVRTTYEPVHPEVAVGALVRAGQVIGTLASRDDGPAHVTCGATPCLHWGARRGSVYIDPLWLVQPPRVRLLPEPRCRSCARVGLPVGGSQTFDRYVRVPLSGGDRGVAQQLGDGTQVGTALEQVRRRRVAQAVGREVWGSRLARHGPVHDAPRDPGVERAPPDAEEQRVRAGRGR